MTRVIDIDRFQEECLALIGSLDADGLVITRRGEPVARLLPIAGHDADKIGTLKGKLQIGGNVLKTGAW
jgi:hypothetical protein